MGSIEKRKKRKKETKEKKERKNERTQHSGSETETETQFIKKKMVTMNGRTLLSVFCLFFFWICTFLFFFARFVVADEEQKKEKKRKEKKKKGATAKPLELRVAKQAPQGHPLTLDRNSVNKNPVIPIKKKHTHHQTTFLIVELSKTQ